MPDGKQFPVVEFDSISHVIICDDPEENAEQLIRERCDALSADAAGLLYFDRENSVLRPLVPMCPGQARCAGKAHAEAALPQSDIGQSCRTGRRLSFR